MGAGGRLRVCRDYLVGRPMPHLLLIDDDPGLLLKKARHAFPLSTGAYGNSRGKARYPTNRRPRFEPRCRWPRDLPYAKPWSVVKSESAHGSKWK